MVICTGNETLGIPGHQRNKPAEAEELSASSECCHTLTITASQGRSVKTLEPDEATATVGEGEGNADKCQSSEKAALRELRQSRLVLENSNHKVQKYRILLTTEATI